MLENILLHAWTSQSIYFQVELTIAGGCRNAEDETRVKKLKELSREWNLTSNIKWKLNVAYEELFDALSVGALPKIITFLKLDICLNGLPMLTIPWAVVSYIRKCCDAESSLTHVVSNKLVHAFQILGLPFADINLESSLQRATCDAFLLRSHSVKFTVWLGRIGFILFSLRCYFTSRGQVWFIHATKMTRFPILLNPTTTSSLKRCEVNVKSCKRMITGFFL